VRAGSQRKGEFRRNEFPMAVGGTLIRPPLLSLLSCSNWHGGNMDPDAVKRHQRGLKRMGFKNHNGVYGDFGF